MASIDPSFAQARRELVYRPQRPWGDESYGLAAAIAWQRATRGLPPGARFIAASGLLGEGGVIEPVDETSFARKIDAVLEADPRPDLFLYASKQPLAAIQPLLQELRREGIEPQPVTRLADYAEHWGQATTPSPSPVGTTRPERRTMSISLLGTALAAGMAGTALLGPDWDFSLVKERWLADPPLVETPSAPPPLAAKPRNKPQIPARNSETRCVPATGNMEKDELKAELKAQSAWQQRSQVYIREQSKTDLSDQGSTMHQSIHRESDGVLQGVTRLKSEQRNGQRCVTVGPVAGG